MNFKGIGLLRYFGFPKPKMETIHTYLSVKNNGLENIVDLSNLYKDSMYATIIVLDGKERIDQNQLFEKDEKEYNIKKENFTTTLEKLVKNLKKKPGVTEEEIVFITHQSYSNGDISYSGKCAINIDENSFGKIYIDAIEGLRKENTDFQPNFIYIVPVIAGRVDFKNEKIINSNLPSINKISNNNSFKLPRIHLTKLIKDILKFSNELKIIFKNSGNPIMDFEVRKTGSLFYHDASLSNKGNYGFLENILSFEKK